MYQVWSRSCVVYTYTHHQWSCVVYIHTSPIIFISDKCILIWLSNPTTIDSPISPQIMKAGVDINFLNSLSTVQLNLPHSSDLPKLPKPVRDNFYHEHVGIIQGALFSIEFFCQFSKLNYCNYLPRRFLVGAPVALCSAQRIVRPYAGNYTIRFCALVINHQKLIMKKIQMHQGMLVDQDSMTCPTSQNQWIERHWKPSTTILHPRTKYLS